MKNELVQFYGLTSKPILSNEKIILHPYSQIHELFNISFDLVCIFASRTPSECDTFSEYFNVNKLIINTLSQLKLNLIGAKILFISSFAVYSSDAISIDENSTVYKSHPYPKSKIQLESDLFDWGESLSIPVIVTRMPVFLYEGVNTNFMGRLASATKNSEEFSLSNKYKKLEAVFDTDHLVKLARCSFDKHTTVNCSANPDITFEEIADLAMSYGLKKINWIKSEKPSVTVSKEILEQVIGKAPSARSIINLWFKKEFGY